MRRAAVLMGIAVMAACARTPREAHSAPVAGSSGADTSKTAQAGAQPAAASGEDRDLPPGIDVSKLDEFGKKVFFRIANSEPSVCGQAQSLMRSAKDRSCRKSFYALRSVARLVEHGFTDSEVSDALSRRYRDNPKRTIDVAEAPMEGSAGGRVVLVTFSDYECPHCKRFHQVLQQVLQEFRGDVKLYLKNYPLPQHANARQAAEAAIAANKQGKFEAFDDKLWSNQDSLEPKDLERYAKEVGLDVERWRKDFGSSEVKERVQKDKSEGHALGLSSTPMLFLNGREYTDSKDVESLKDWINEELGR